MERPDNTMRYFQEHYDISPEIYYHYTSLEALYNIVSSKTFRMTSLKSSNDKKELSYRSGNFISDFKSMCDAEKDQNTKNYFKLILKSYNQNTQTFSNLCTAKRTPYALCLSNCRDNLTHWDRYASNCTGVCIGVNLSALKVHFKRTPIEPFGMILFDVGDTLYTAETLKKYIRNTTINFIDWFQNLKSENETLEESILKNGYMCLAVICRRIMKFAKNGAFLDEDEVRLYHESESISDTLHLLNLMFYEGEDTKKRPTIKKYYKSLVEQLGLNEENFMITKAGIRSYRNLCLEEVWGSGAIPEIILGPMCTQNKNELRRFLKANGLDKTKISVSEIPIR
ncbi:MAG: DUF2971 domain-containing protein [Clostridia bacterium]|nr:DUF2971 domain-containing protein [Clostridia bacterium]